MKRYEPDVRLGFALCLMSGGVLFGLLYGISAILMNVVR